MAKPKKGDLVDGMAEETRRQRVSQYVQLHTNVKSKGAEFLWECIEAGTFALVMKEGLSHGEFSSWLEDCEVAKHGPSVRTSQRYMACAKRAQSMGLNSKNDIVALLGDDATVGQLIGSAKNSMPSGGDRNPKEGDGEANGIALRLASVLSGEEAQVKRLSEVAVEYPDFAQSKEYDTMIRSRKTIMNKLRALIGDEDNRH